MYNSLSSRRCFILIINPLKNNRISKRVNYSALDRISKLLKSEKRPRHMRIGSRPQIAAVAESRSNGMPRPTTCGCSITAPKKRETEKQEFFASWRRTIHFLINRFLSFPDMENSDSFVKTSLMLSTMLKTKFQERTKKNIHFRKIRGFCGNKNSLFCIFGSRKVGSGYFSIGGFSILELIALIPYIDWFMLFMTILSSLFMINENHYNRLIGRENTGLR